MPILKTRLWNSKTKRKVPFAPRDLTPKDSLKCQLILITSNLAQLFLKCVNLLNDTADALPTFPEPLATEIRALRSPFEKKKESKEKNIKRK